MGNRIESTRRYVTEYAVWGLRLLIGAVFILSGLTKMIDLWGFVFKLEQYLSVWDIAVPRSLVLIGAMGVSAYEFILGVMLATGSFRRVTPPLLLLSMVVMLPLTGYIALYDPVDDCGCFGDFLKISNSATFIKNIFITAALIYLCRNNVKARCRIYQPAAQWAPAILSFLYIIVIGLVGYNVQPLVDFRQFPVGADLLGRDSEEDVSMPVFIYEKDGRQEQFQADALPDDQWTYVDRIDGTVSTKSLVIYSPDGEDEVTDDVIEQSGEQLILVIPEPARADISYTYVINELYQAISDHGGSMIALLAAGQDGINRWLDMSMAAYPCYSVEDTQLKELARGVMSLVYLNDGKVMWKRTVSSIDIGTIEHIKANGYDDNLHLLDFDGHDWMMKITAVYLAAMVFIFIIQLAVDKLNTKNSRKPEKTV